MGYGVYWRYNNDVLTTSTTTEEKKNMKKIISFLDLFDYLLFIQNLKASPVASLQPHTRTQVDAKKFT